ncbi:MAG: DUF1501 domain-containing protein [Verrucomicrobiales bacterium]|nr:DUF1501 domain-containing protein [Verrucomicrobiales bacterium]
MLNIYSSAGDSDCSGISRRDWLRAGVLGMGSISLPGFLMHRAAAASTGVDYLRDKSVVLLYLSGGASHIETFNPNMGAHAPYCSLTGEVKTTVPGLTFGGNFTRLAKQAHRMSIVRSFTHPVGNHDLAHGHVLTGGTDRKGDGKEGFSMGSMYLRLAGATHAMSGLPNFTLLTHPEVDGQYRKEQDRVIRGSAPRDLGAANGPFWINHGSSGKYRGRDDRGGSLAKDMELSLPQVRLQGRRTLLREIDRLRRDLDTSGQLESADRFQQQAYDLMLGNAMDTLDLSREDPRTLERYDTSHINIGHKKLRKSDLGKQMLMARRLVESGCGFVTVHSAGWDMHADGNNPGVVPGFQMLGTTLDIAVSAFIGDLADRGMLDKTLLVITGDFGRTPKVNKKGGRDHWARLCTLAFAGGGLPGGAVIGKADKRNGEPADHPVSPKDMMGTIFHTLFDMGQLRVARGLPRDLIQKMENMKPIEGLA